MEPFRNRNNFQVQVGVNEHSNRAQIGQKGGQIYHLRFKEVVFLFCAVLLHLWMAADFKFIETDTFYLHMTFALKHKNREIKWCFSSRCTGPALSFWT